VTALVHAALEERSYLERPPAGAGGLSCLFGKQLGAERRLAVINPLRYLAWQKRGKAVEAPTERTALHFGAVQTAMLVRLGAGRNGGGFSPSMTLST
jgi:hypothetical protein